MHRMEEQLSVTLILILIISSAYSSNCEHKLDLIAVLDGSGSISNKDFIKLKSAVTNLVDGLNVGSGHHRFGAVVFSSKVSDKILLGDNAQLIKSQISRIKQPKGRTATDLGIVEMTQIFRRQARSGARKVGIVITDGRSRSESKTRSAALKAKAAGIIMFAVGVGTKMNEKELRDIASSTSNVIELKDFNALQTSIKSLLKKVCQVDGAWSSWSNPSSGQCSATCGGGTRTVTRTRTCTNPSPSNGGKNCAGSATKTEKETCKKQQCSDCQHKLDLIAVLDGSSSISRRDFMKLKKAVTNLVDGLNVGPGQQRFGAVVFSSKVSNTISLGDSARLIKAQISRIKQPKGRTATDLAIVKMTQMFQSQGRPQAKKVGIVITDGRSKNQHKTRSAALNAKESGILMFAVGVGTKIKENELRSIASSKSNVIEITDFNALQNSIKSLLKKVCQVDGAWSGWSNPSSGRCSATCGGGTRTVSRTRSCTNPSPRNGGKDCTGSAKQTEKKACNTQPCPVNGRWSRWCVKRGPCSASCGGGKRTVTRSRTCTNPSPSNGGKHCAGPSTKTYKRACNKRKCPVNGGWSKWKVIKRSKCRGACGGATRTVIRARTCTNPRPRRRGQRCVGPMRETLKEACDMQKCKI